MSDVFISYSRLDGDFVKKLHDAFASEKMNVWIDWEDIPPSQAWWDEIQSGIAKANNVLVVLSPNSMASPICQLEIETARRQNKRVIPVLHAEYDREDAVRAIAARLANPEQDAARDLWGSRQPYDVYDANDSELKHINYFFFRPEDDFASHASELVEIIRTDYTHKEKHTTLNLRASEWLRRSRDASFLLLDNELADAEAWLAESPGKIPAPTPLHLDYIAASEKRTRQLRNIRRASVIGSAVALIAIVLAAAAALVGANASARANEAQAQAATATRQVATAAALQATAESDVALLEATATQIPPTLTQAAVISDEALTQQDIAFSLADALLSLASDWNSGIAIVDDLIDRYPDRPTAYLARALFYDQAGEFDLALADYTTAIQLAPDDPLNYYNRGGLYADMESYDLALDDFARAIDLDAGFIDAYLGRADVYQALEKYDLALADYNAVLDMGEESAEVYTGRGDAYYGLDDLDLALADLDMAVSLDPEYADAYFIRGLVHYDQENDAQALDDWATAEDLGYELPDDVIALRDDLQSG